MKVPRHIGVILDGNRRFAKKLMIKPWKGHEWGAKKVEKLIEWAREIGVEELTLYAFSIENFNRPKLEFNYLMKIFNEEYERVLNDKKIMTEKIRFNFVGRLHMFPKDLQLKMKKLMEKTKNNDKLIVNIAMAYGGRAEVIDAIKKIVDSGVKSKDVTEELIDANVYNASKPDLIIRTSGEHRTSGFLIWAGAYAELIFVEKNWPEFEKEDFLKCIEDYCNRDRRFGK